MFKLLGALVGAARGKAKSHDRGEDLECTGQGTRQDDSYFLYQPGRGRQPAMRCTANLLHNLPSELTLGARVGGSGNTPMTLQFPRLLVTISTEGCKHETPPSAASHGVIRPRA